MPSSCLSLDCHSSWHSRLFIKSSKKAAELQWGHWLETRMTHTVDVTLLALWRVWQWTPWRHSAHGGHSPKWLCFQLAVVSMLRPLLFLKLLIRDQMKSTSIFAIFQIYPDLFHPTAYGHSDLQALSRTKPSQRCNMVSAGSIIIWFSHFIHRQISASSSKQPSPSPLDTRAFSFHMTYCVVQCDVSSISCSLKETSFHLAFEYLRI